MEELFKNGIVQGVIATLIVTVIIWIITLSRARFDEKKIIKYLVKSASETSHTFRSTHAISAALDISEERIRKICSKSRNVKRNQKEKESWQLK